MTLKLSRLDDSRVDESFEVLNQVAKWIQSQGRRQRIANTTLEVYRKWQSEKSNFIVTEDDKIVGIVTLRTETLVDWPDQVAIGPIQMIRALATHPEHRGKGIGEFAMREVILQSANGNPVYLDCVSGFLPEYYANLGFSVVQEQIRDYGEEGSFPITLMRYAVGLSETDVGNQ